MTVVRDEKDREFFVALVEFLLLCQHEFRKNIKVSTYSGPIEAARNLIKRFDFESENNEIVRRRREFQNLFTTLTMSLLNRESISCFFSILQVEFPCLNRDYLFGFYSLLDCSNNQIVKVLPSRQKQLEEPKKPSKDFLITLGLLMATIGKRELFIVHRFFDLKTYGQELNELIVEILLILRDKSSRMENFLDDTDLCLATYYAVKGIELYSSKGAIAIEHLNQYFAVLEALKRRKEFESSERSSACSTLIKYLEAVKLNIDNPQLRVGGELQGRRVSEIVEVTRGTLIDVSKLALKQYSFALAIILAVENKVYSSPILPEEFRDYGHENLFSEVQNYVTLFEDLEYESNNVRTVAHNKECYLWYLLETNEVKEAY